MKVTFKKNEQLESDAIVLHAKEKNKEIETIIDYITTISKTIIGKQNNCNFSIPICDYINFYSSQKNIYGTTLEKEVTISYRLYELEAILPANFVRISNTEIINLNFVSDFSLTNNGFILITFKNGKKSSSSRRFLKKIKEKLL